MQFRILKLFYSFCLKRLLQIVCIFICTGYTKNVPLGGFSQSLRRTFSGTPCIVDCQSNII